MNIGQTRSRVAIAERDVERGERRSGAKAASTEGEPQASTNIGGLK
jgi:hypothetical protein